MNASHHRTFAYNLLFTKSLDLRFLHIYFIYSLARRQIRWYASCKEAVLKTATPRITRSTAQHQLERDNIVATQQLAKHDDDAVWSRIPAPRNTYNRRRLWSQLKSKMTVDTIKNRCTPLGPANRLATAPRKCSSCQATPTPIPNQTPPPVNGPADFGGLEDFDFEFALVQDEDEVMLDHEEGKGGEEVQDVVKQSAVLYDPQPSSEELIITLGDSSYTLEAGLQYIQACFKEESYPLCLQSINQIDLANFRGEKFRERITNLVDAKKLYEGHYPLQVHRKIWAASYQKVRAHHNEKHKTMMVAKRIIQIWGAVIVRPKDTVYASRKEATGGRRLLKGAASVLKILVYASLTKGRRLKGAASVPKTQSTIRARNRPSKTSPTTIECLARQKHLRFSSQTGSYDSTATLHSLKPAATTRQLPSILSNRQLRFDSYLPFSKTGSYDSTATFDSLLKPAATIRQLPLIFFFCSRTYRTTVLELYLLEIFPPTTPDFNLFSTVLDCFEKAWSFKAFSSPSTRTFFPGVFAT
ncbi:MAG: hypothetical protein MMC33_010482 [Icmadophila ericetorum]|nr:hypothetical protein [Icmadophila ericetorum]